MLVWDIFEAEGVDVMLANAQKVEVLLGKETDRADAE